MKLILHGCFMNKKYSHVHLFPDFSAYSIAMTEDTKNRLDFNFDLGIFLASYQAIEETIVRNVSLPLQEEMIFRYVSK